MSRWSVDPFNVARGLAATLVLAPLAASAVVVDQHAVHRSLESVFLAFVALVVAVGMGLVAWIGGRERRRQHLRRAAVALSASGLAAVGAVVVVGESGDFTRLESSMLGAGALVVGVCLALVAHALLSRAKRGSPE